jgi:hypothetical protein
LRKRLAFGGKGTGGRVSYRQISARLKDTGYVNDRGQPFNALNWNTARKNFACSNAPATLDAFCIAGARNPIRAAAAHKYKIFGSDAPEQPFQGRGVTAPARYGRRHLMCVHR